MLTTGVQQVQAAENASVDPYGGDDAVSRDKLVCHEKLRHHARDVNADGKGRALSLEARGQWSAKRLVEDAGFDPLAIDAPNPYAHAHMKDAAAVFGEVRPYANWLDRKLSDHLVWCAGARRTFRVVFADFCSTWHGARDAAALRMQPRADVKALFDNALLDMSAGHAVLALTVCRRGLSSVAASDADCEVIRDLQTFAGMQYAVTLKDWHHYGTMAFRVFYVAPYQMPDSKTVDSKHRKRPNPSLVSPPRAKRPTPDVTPSSDADSKRLSVKDRPALDVPRPADADGKRLSVTVHSDEDGQFQARCGTANCSYASKWYESRRGALCAFYDHRRRIRDNGGTDHE